MRFLADVEGYKGNPSYSVFYSVFLCSRFLLFTPKIQLHVGGKSIFRTTGKVFMSKANEVRPSLGHLILETLSLHIVYITTI